MIMVRWPGTSSGISSGHGAWEMQAARDEEANRAPGNGPTSSCSTARVEDAFANALANVNPACDISLRPGYDSPAIHLRKLMTPFMSCVGESAMSWSEKMPNFICNLSGMLGNCSVDCSEFLPIFSQSTTTSPFGVDFRDTYSPSTVIQIAPAT